METKTWALASYPTPPSAMANRPFAAHALWSRMCWNRLKAAWRGRQSLKWRYAVTRDSIAEAVRMACEAPAAYAPGLVQ